MIVSEMRLVYAVAVARAGSFTLGAEAVGITQSAMTKSVADLERQIGFAIFYRTKRGAFLTSEGRDFVEQATRMNEDMDNLLRRRREHDDVYAGTLRIGVGPASMEWRLIEPLCDLIQRHPGIRVDINGSTFERTVQLLRNGAIDVALGFDAAFSDWTDIRRESVSAIQSVLFVRKDHPILGRPSLSMSDLAAFDFVSPSDGRPYGAVLRKIYENEGIDWRKRLHTVDYFPLVRRLVAKSDAIGVVSMPYAGSTSFRRNFETLDQLDVLPLSPLCCAVRARWEPKPAVRAFIRAVKDARPVRVPVLQTGDVGHDPALE